MAQTHLVIAQLECLYSILVRGRLHNRVGFAAGLLNPHIRALTESGEDNPTLANLNALHRKMFSEIGDEDLKSFLSETIRAIQHRTF